jgi:hypothetical protein
MFPYLTIVQFPWRLLFFTTFFSAILVAHLAQYWLKWPVMIGLLIVVSGYARGSLGINYFHHINDYWFTFPLNTTILNENDPIWYRRTQALEILAQHAARPIILAASGSAVIESWNGHTHSYRLLVDQPAQIIEPTLYFPGWQTTIDGQAVDLAGSADRFAGLLNYDLPVGEHTITSRFTQRTPARLVGNSLSLIGLGALFMLKRKYAK